MVLGQKPSNKEAPYLPVFKAIILVGCFNMYVRKLVLLILGGKSILAVHVVEKSDKS